MSCSKSLTCTQSWTEKKRLHFLPSILSYVPWMEYKVLPVVRECYRPDVRFQECRSMSCEISHFVFFFWFLAHYLLFCSFFIWVALWKKVPYVLSLCHTKSRMDTRYDTDFLDSKRRIGPAMRTHPLFSMTIYLIFLLFSGWRTGGITLLSLVLPSRLWYHPPIKSSQHPLLGSITFIARDPSRTRAGVLGDTCDTCDTTRQGV